MAGKIRDSHNLKAVIITAKKLDKTKSMLYSYNQ